MPFLALPTMYHVFLRCPHIEGPSVNTGIVFDYDTVTAEINITITSSIIIYEILFIYWFVYLIIDMYLFVWLIYNLQIELTCHRISAR